MKMCRKSEDRRWWSTSHANERISEAAPTAISLAATQGRCLIDWTEG